MRRGRGPSPPHEGPTPAKPYPVLVPSLDAALRLCADFPDCARRLAEAFWPGPLTLLLPARPGLPPGYTAGTGVIGLRIARHHPTVAHTLATLPGGVTGTSANRAAGPPARSASEVRAAFAGADAGADDAPDLILDGGSSHAPAPSSVVDCRSPPAVRVVREGAIPASDIVEVAAGR